MLCNFHHALGATVYWIAGPNAGYMLGEVLAYIPAHSDPIQVLASVGLTPEGWKPKPKPWNRDRYLMKLIEHPRWGYVIRGTRRINQGQTAQS